MTNLIYVNCSGADAGVLWYYRQSRRRLVAGGPERSIPAFLSHAPRGAWTAFHRPKRSMLTRRFETALERP
jgi:hypothetical protein